MKPGRTNPDVPQTRVGISGWRYKPWRGRFYPAGLPQRMELEFASRCFSSIEINGSFYSLQQVDNWLDWYRRTPERFVFAVKGSRFISHMKRLKDIEKPLANFFAQGILGLKEKLGPILWQFPPNFRFEPESLERFFDLLPKNTRAALDLARHRDHRMKGRSYLRLWEEVPLRHAIEVRHESFRAEDFTTLLRTYNIGLVIADTAGKWPFLDDVTADFVYVRLHGDEEIYVSGYTAPALQKWAARVRQWQQSRDVYVYFDNDVKVRAPFDAMELYKRLRPAAVPPMEGKVQLPKLEDFMPNTSKKPESENETTKTKKPAKSSQPGGQVNNDLNSSEQEEENRSIRQRALKSRDQKTIEPNR